MPQIPSNSDLIADFETFLRYLESKPNLPMTSAGDLKSADLWNLNERVNYKAPDFVTPKSRVMNYPLLGFLFQVAIAGRLFMVQFGKANTLVAVPDRLKAYQNMTEEEKYLFLLETAWCYVDWSTLDGDDRTGTGADWLREGSDALLKNPVGVWVKLFTRGWVMEGNPRLIHVGYNVNTYVRLGHWLGWYDLKELPQTKNDRYSLAIDCVALTEWGRDCLAILRLYRPFHFWNQNTAHYFESAADKDYDEEVKLSQFAAIFRTECNEPNLLSLYPINANPPTGTYWLRVALPAHGVSRTLALSAKNTLNQLHEQIQKAFQFGNDHLYGFYLNARSPYNGIQFFDPRIAPGYADGYPANKTTLGNLHLYVGQRLLYIFDFGDNWQFMVTVVKHLPDQNTTKVEIVEQVGKAPGQYGDDY